MGLLAVCSILVVFIVPLAGAEVFWFEVEDYDAGKSNLTFKEQGLNVVWNVEEDPEAFNNQYLIPTDPNRYVVEAAAGLVYMLPRVDDPAGWQLWVRSIMPTSGSDSFFYQVSQDGGNTWSAPTVAHGGFTEGDPHWEVWEWHRPWDVDGLATGEGNAIRIAEREQKAKLDVICLRNDGQTPTDAEYEDYLKQQEPIPSAVDARRKIAGTWGKMKSDVSLDH